MSLLSPWNISWIFHLKLHHAHIPGKDKWPPRPDILIWVAPCPERALNSKNPWQYYVKNKYSNFRDKRNNIFQVEMSSSLHLLWHKLMMVILSKSNSASWDVACWERTLDLFVANVFLVPTLYLLAFSHSLLSHICCHVVRLFFLIILCEWVFCILLCLCTKFVPGAQGHQKSAAHPLELKHRCL